MQAPIPDAAPVISATLFSSLIGDPPLINFVRAQYRADNRQSAFYYDKAFYAAALTIPHSPLVGNLYFGRQLLDNLLKKMGKERHQSVPVPPPMNMTFVWCRWRSSERPACWRLD
jgi:hypothetical protein